MWRNRTSGLEKKELYKLGIQWQRRPKKKKKKKVVNRAAGKREGSRTTTVIFKKTRKWVVHGEGAMEITREWRRRSDQEGEEHLGNS